MRGLDCPYSVHPDTRVATGNCRITSLLSGTRTSLRKYSSRMSSTIRSQVYVSCPPVLGSLGLIGVIDLNIRRPWDLLSPQSHIPPQGCAASLRLASGGVREAPPITVHPYDSPIAREVPRSAVPAHHQGVLVPFSTLECSRRVRRPRSGCGVELEWIFASTSSDETTLVSACMVPVAVRVVLPIHVG